MQRLIIFLSGEAGVQTGLGRSGRGTGERKTQHLGSGEGEGEGGERESPGQVKESISRWSYKALYFYYYDLIEFLSVFSGKHRQLCTDAVFTKVSILLFHSLFLSLSSSAFIFSYDFPR